MLNLGHESSEITPPHTHTHFALKARWDFFLPCKGLDKFMEETYSIYRHWYTSFLCFYIAFKVVCIGRLIYVTIFQWVCDNMFCGKDSPNPQRTRYEELFWLHAIKLPQTTLCQAQTGPQDCSQFLARLATFSHTPLLSHGSGSSIQQQLRSATMGNSSFWDSVSYPEWDQRCSSLVLQALQQLHHSSTSPRIGLHGTILNSRC